MKFLPLLIALSACVASLHAATVSYDSGGGSSTVVFETTSGTEAVGATMFIGTFTSPPTLGSTSLDDVLNNFLTFDTHGTTSGTAGNFIATSFSGTAVPNFASQKIYLVVTDTADPSLASQFAVVASSDAGWTFPGNDTNAPPAAISLPAANEYYAGSGDSIQNPGPITGTFNSIQFAAVPEPSSSLLLLLGGLAILRRRR